MPDEARQTPIVLISSDMRLPRLISEGFSVVSESWGAHVDFIDGELLERLRRNVQAVTDQGIDIREVPPRDDSLIANLDQTTRDDYPQTLATPHRDLELPAIQDLRVRGFEFFGAFEGLRLVGLTALALRNDRSETELTAVDRAYRRRGIASAVKSHSMLAALARGGVSFGTGGAGTNIGSRRANERCGYVIDELWLTLQPRLQP